MHCVVAAIDVVVDHSYLASPDVHPAVRDHECATPENGIPARASYCFGDDIAQCGGRAFPDAEAADAETVVGIAIDDGD
jgi:hypothetical protein